MRWCLYEHFENHMSDCRFAEVHSALPPSSGHSGLVQGKLTFEMIESLSVLFVEWVLGMVTPHKKLYKAHIFI